MAWTSEFLRTLLFLRSVKYLSKICTAKNQVRSEQRKDVQTSIIQSTIFVRYSLVIWWPSKGFLAVKLFFLLKSSLTYNELRILLLFSLMSSYLLLSTSSIPKSVLNFLSLSWAFIPWMSLSKEDCSFLSGELCDFPLFLTTRSLN